VGGAGRDLGEAWRGGDVERQTPAGPEGLVGPAEQPDALLGLNAQ
jgi:hypothetical protein